jgi:hypothetical protein
MFGLLGDVVIGQKSDSDTVCEYVEGGGSGAAERTESAYVSGPR